MRSTLAISLAICAAVLVPLTAHGDEPVRPGTTALESINEATAHEAAERIACTSPQARRYLNQTLRAIETRRWGSVTKNFQGDTVDLVADAVYAAASAPSDPRMEPLRKFVTPPAQSCEPNERAAAQRALLEADERPNDTEVDRCTARPLAERRRDPACSLAAAVRAGLDGDIGTAQANVADVVAATTFDAIYTGKSLNDAQKDVVFEHIAYELREVLVTEPNDETIDTDVLRAFGGVDLDAVRGWRCKDTAELVKDLAEGQVDPQDAFCSATRADLQTEKVNVTIIGPSGEPRTMKLTGLLDIASAAERGPEVDDEAPPPPTPAPKPGAKPAAKPEPAPPPLRDRDARVAEAVLCSIPFSAADKAFADCSTGALKATKAGAFRIEIGSAVWMVAVAPPGGKTERLRVESPSHLGLASLVEGTTESLALRANITTLVRDKLLGEDPSPETIRDLAIVALRLRRVARALDDAVASSDRRAYILSPLESLPALLPRFGPNAAPPPAPCEQATTALDRMRCAATGPLRKIIISAEDGQVRELSSRVATLVGQRDRTCVGSAGPRLLEAFAANVPDARARDEGTPLATEELRAAARDLAACSPNDADDAFVRFSVVPSPGVRFSWNSAYVNAWGSDGFRIAPSLDMVSLRFRLTPRSSRVRAGLVISAIDLAAPLTELAMRRGDLRYDRQEMIWLDAIRPRLDFTFGVPAVSRHFYISGGFSLRTVAPYRGGVGKPQTTLTYLAVGTPGGAAAESFASYVEYNLAMKWLF